MSALLTGWTPTSNLSTAIPSQELQEDPIMQSGPLFPGNKLEVNKVTCKTMRNQDEITENHQQDKCGSGEEMDRDTQEVIMPPTPSRQVREWG